MSLAAPEVPPRVTFDVNVYLDVAKILGPDQVYVDDNPQNALESTFAYLLHRVRREEHPCFVDDNRHVDSLRALALAGGLATTGQSAPREPELSWQIGLSQHIVATIAYVLTSDQHDYRWPAQAADAFRDMIVRPLFQRAKATDGGFVHVSDPVGYPPLEDHEDGLVMATAHQSNSLLVVTGDGHFVSSADELSYSIEYANQFIDRNIRLRRPLAARSVGVQLGWAL